MMGRFIDGIAQCQQACREDKKYEASSNDPRARDILLLDKSSYLMDEDVSFIFSRYGICELSLSIATERANRAGQVRQSRRPTNP